MAKEKNKVNKPAVQNAGKCCACKYYGKPCLKTKKYVPRKQEACPNYKERA